MTLWPDLKLFYYEQLNAKTTIFGLGEVESHHAIHVVRLKKGDEITVTNGKGLMARCKITSSEKKTIGLTILETFQAEQDKNKIHLAISPVKKREKIEWLIEKATEIGVNEISFFLSAHSERMVINYERLEKIIIPAVKQSLNPYKPIIHPLQNFEKLLINNAQIQDKFIADCKTESEHHLVNYLQHPADTIILIGPEGGFTEGEIQFARQQNYIPVSLGTTRLRSETAAVYASSVIKAFQFKILQNNQY